MQRNRVIALTVTGAAVAGIATVAFTTHHSRHHPAPRPTTTSATPTPVPSTSTPAPKPTTTSPTPVPSTSSSTAPPAGWANVFYDDFTIPAPTGTFGTTDASKVVYTGDHGGKWIEYPDGWPSTYTSGKSGYEPGQVLSVHDGVLDFYLHNVNGLPAGANPSPVLASGSVYQTYGRYTVRMRIDSSMADYHAAFLRWPQTDSNYTAAESDFPEFDLNSTSVSAFAHNTVDGQDAFSTGSGFDPTQWHVYTEEWGPGYRTYSVDGKVIGTSTHNAFAGPERFQLQTEPSGKNDGDSGHLLVDYVSVDARN